MVGTTTIQIFSARESFELEEENTVVVKGIFVHRLVRTVVKKIRKVGSDLGVRAFAVDENFMPNFDVVLFVLAMGVVFEFRVFQN